MDQEGRLRFHQATRLVYELWTALRLVLDHRESNEEKAGSRISELCELTVDFFCREWEDGLSTDEVAANLEAFVTHYYDIEIEDGSYEDVSWHLCHLYSRLRHGEDSGFKRLLEEYSVRSTVPIKSLEVSNRINAEASESTSCDEDSPQDDDLPEPTELSKSDLPVSTAESGYPSEVDEEGFQIYRRSKPRRRV